MAFDRIKRWIKGGEDKKIQKILRRVEEAREEAAREWSIKEFKREKRKKKIQEEPEETARYRLTPLGRTKRLDEDKKTERILKEVQKARLQEMIKHIQDNIGRLEDRKLAEDYQNRLRKIESGYRLTKGARFSDLDINTIKECEEALTDLKREVDESIAKEIHKKIEALKAEKRGLRAFRELTKKVEEEESRVIFETSLNKLSDELEKLTNIRAKFHSQGLDVSYLDYYIRKIRESLSQNDIEKTRELFSRVEPHIQKLSNQLEDKKRKCSQKLEEFVKLCQKLQKSGFDTSILDRYIKSAEYSLKTNDIKAAEAWIESGKKEIEKMKRERREPAYQRFGEALEGMEKFTKEPTEKVAELFEHWGIKPHKPLEEIVAEPREYKGKIPTKKDWERLETMIRTFEETLNEYPDVAPEAKKWLEAAKTSVELSRNYLLKRADAVKSVEYLKKAKKEIEKARKLIQRAMVKRDVEKARKFVKESAGRVKEKVKTAAIAAGKEIKERAKTEEGRVKHAINYAKGRLEKEANRIKKEIEKEIKKREKEIKWEINKEKNEIRRNFVRYNTLKNKAEKLEKEIYEHGLYQWSAHPAVIQYRDYLKKMSAYERYKTEKRKLLKEAEKRLNARLDEEERRLKEGFKERLMAAVPSIIDEACEKYKIRELRGYVETPVWAMANRLIASGFDEISKRIRELKDFTVRQFESPLRILAGIGRGVELVPSAAGGGIEGIISILLTTLLSPVMVGAVIICIMFVTLGSAISGIFSGWTFTFAFVFAALFVLIEFSRVWHEITREELRKISEKGE